MKKIDQVVITIDSNYLNQTAVLVHDLDLYSNIQTLHILTQNCDTHFQNSLLKLVRNSHFDILFYPIDQDLKELKNIHPDRGIPTVTYGKVLIAKILPESIEKVLYLDIDIKIREKLDLLLATDFDGTLGAVRQKTLLIHNENGSILDSYFNAGVLVLNLSSWRNRNLDAKILQLLDLRGPFKYMDQDLLNIVCENSWYELDQRFNFFSEATLRFYPSRKENSITHFAGPFKPWIYPVASKLHREWRKTERGLIGDSPVNWIESNFGYSILCAYRLLVPKSLSKRLRTHQACISRFFRTELI